MNSAALLVEFLPRTFSSLDCILQQVFLEDLTRNPASCPFDERAGHWYRYKHEKSYIFVL